MCEIHFSPQLCTDGRLQIGINIMECHAFPHTQFDSLIRTDCGQNFCIARQEEVWLHSECDKSMWLCVIAYTWPRDMHLERMKVRFWHVSTAISSNVHATGIVDMVEVHS